MSRRAIHASSSVFKIGGRISLLGTGRLMSQMRMQAFFFRLTA